MFSFILGFSSEEMEEEINKSKACWIPGGNVCTSKTMT